MSLLRFDELNNLKSRLSEVVIEGVTTHRVDRERLIDSILDYLLFCYLDGVDDANNELGTQITPNADEIDTAINFRIDGLTYSDRVNKHIDDYEMKVESSEDNGKAVDELVNSLTVLADTEGNRDFNTGKFNTAVTGKAGTKTWMTMLDDRVRDAHSFLEGVTVPMDGLFYAPTGESARYPGDFGVPELDCGCRCELKYGK